MIANYQIYDKGGWIIASYIKLMDMITHRGPKLNAGFEFIFVNMRSRPGNWVKFKYRFD